MLYLRDYHRVLQRGLEPAGAMRRFLRAGLPWNKLFQSEHPWLTAPH